MTRRIIPFQKVTIEDVFIVAMDIKNKIANTDDPILKEELYKQFQVVGGIYASLYELDKSLMV